MFQIWRLWNRSSTEQILLVFAASLHHFDFQFDVVDHFWGWLSFDSPRLFSLHRGACRRRTRQWQVLMIEIHYTAPLVIDSGSTVTQRRVSHKKIQWYGPMLWISRPLCKSDGAFMLITPG